MKKLALFFCSFLFTIAILFAQKPFFNKKITNKYEIHENQVLATNDGGGLLVGSVYEPDPVTTYKSAALVIKFDENGSIEFNKKIKDTWQIKYAMALKNGNYFIVYEDNMPRRFLTLLDKDFTPIWTLKLGGALFTLNIDNFIELSDGHIAIAGLYRPSPTYGFLVAVLNQTSGAVIWSKQYENIDASGLDNICRIKETNDGQIVVSAMIMGNDQTTGQPIKWKSKLVKIARLDGNIIWQKEFTSNFNNFEVVNEVFEDNDGNFYLFFSSIDLSGFFPTNYKEGKNGIVKLDKDANMKWFRAYGTGTTVYMSSLLQKKDGNLLILMYSYDNQSMNYLNINQNGDIITQSREFSPQYGGTKACFINDGSLITAGGIRKCGLSIDIYLQKRTNNGTGNCTETSDLKVSNESIAQSNYFKDIQVKKVNPLSKNTNPKIEDYMFSIANENIFCQDTTFIKRCEGDVYAVGNNKYTKDGVYKDTLNIASCDSVVLSKVIFSKNEIKPIDTTICTGKSFFFNQKNYDKEGFYKEVLKNSLGCDSTISLNLKIQDLAITVSDDVTVSTAEKTVLSAISNFPNVQWQWLPSTYLNCTDCPNPTATPFSSIIYTIKAKSKQGCSAEAKINVDTKVCNQVFIPTAFSPNDDGINDQLSIFTTDCATKIVKYTIYDRWGTMVYERSDFSPNDSNTYGWDGKYNNQIAQTGVYVYKISIEFTDGKTRNYSGDVVLE